MGGENFILTYLQSCIGGKLAFSDCGPIWQMAIIAAVLVAAVICLLALKLRPPGQSGQS